MNQVNYKKKYNEALERMKSWARGEHPECFTEARKAAEFVFPELAESEDERIRKEMIEILKKESHEFPSSVIANKSSSWIAWLEKQGKQGNQRLYDIIISLWDLLDKIDTFADLQIDDTDPDNPFRKIEHITGERHEFVKSDGYNLYIKGEKITDFQEQNIMMFNSTKESKCEENDSSTACLEKQCEKPNNKVKPKFKPGDTIRGKYDAREFTIKTVDLEGGFYTYTQEGCGNDIDYADDVFELVEQNPADKVEPKFNVGDWIISPGGCYLHILNIKNDSYLCEDILGEEIKVLCKHSNFGFKLWAIQDAKDGDVFYSPHCKLLWIYKNENTCHVGYNLNYNSYGIVINKSIYVPADVQPATKKQRDLLFAKMHESGYEWDAGKRELKKNCGLMEIWR